MSAYEQIARGVLRFRRHVFPHRRAVYQALAHHQAPQVLFIGCIDSRVAPAELCHAGPGEMFVERTPGNLVPVYDEAAVGVSASIEYAVVALEVAHIIVCGHSDCGALKGLMHPEKLQVLPAVGRWLSHATEALAEVDAAHPQADAPRAARASQCPSPACAFRHPSLGAGTDGAGAVVATRLGLRHSDRSGRAIRTHGRQVCAVAAGLRASKR